MSNTVGTKPSHSDAFGKRTGVRVAVERKPYTTPKLALALAIMIPVPTLPFFGLVFGSVARRKIREDASLLGIKQANTAARLGLLGTALQVGLVTLVGLSVWTSIEQAKTTIINTTTVLADDGSPVSLRRATATPEFSLFEFRPGSEQTYTLNHPEGADTVRVRFAEAPAWTAWGPLFKAEAVRPTIIAPATASAADTTD